MRFLVDHGGYEMRNMGDAAMLQMAISRIRSLCLDAEIAAFTREPERLSRFCAGTKPVPVMGRELWLQSRNLFGGLHKVLPRALQSGFERLEADLRAARPDFAAGVIRRRLGKRGVDLTQMDAFLSAVHEADAVVFAGGSYLTDSFEWHANVVLETLRLANALGKPTALFGQGIGPLDNPELRRKLRTSFSNAACVTLREERFSRPVLESLGVRTDGIVTTGDDAIELAFRECPAQLGSGLGANLRVARYSGVGEKETEAVREVLKTAAERHGAPILSIPIAWHEGDSDVSAARELLAGLLPDDDFGEEIDSPVRTIQRVGQCRVVVTGSYHGGVFALSQGIPAVCLVKSEYYKNKFVGLADQFGGGCSVVFFTSDRFSQQLARAIEEAWETGPQLRGKLLEEAQRQISLSRKAYEDFLALV